MGGVGYIPLTEVVCYAGEAGFDNRLDFIAVIRALDDVFVKHQNESEKPEA